MKKLKHNMIKILNMIAINNKRRKMFTLINKMKSLKMMKRLKKMNLITILNKMFKKAKKALIYGNTS